MDLERVRVFIERIWIFPFIFPLSSIFTVGEVMASRTPDFKSPVLIKCYKNCYVAVLFPTMMTQYLREAYVPLHKYVPTNPSFNVSLSYPDVFKTSESHISTAVIEEVISVSYVTV